jgi:putative glutamine amidotransferase
MGEGVFEKANRMKPRIGVTAGYTQVDIGPKANQVPADRSLSRMAGEIKVRGEYPQAVEAGGGEPVVLAPLADDELPDDLAGRIDGLLLTGGEDLDPVLWGEPRHPAAEIIDPRRQRSDLRLIEWADRIGLPVLGICLGCQEMAVHRGGRIIQHVPDETRENHRNDRKPRATHEIRIVAASLLAGIVGTGLLEVNSGHHQAVRHAGRGLAVVALSPDGIIEAIEDPTPGRFFLGVQWHPEDLVAEGPHRALFAALCKAAAK